MVWGEGGGSVVGLFVCLVISPYTGHRSFCDLTHLCVCVCACMDLSHTHTHTKLLHHISLCKKTGGWGGGAKPTISKKTSPLFSPCFLSLLSSTKLHTVYSRTHTMFHPSRVFWVCCILTTYYSPFRNKQTKKKKIIFIIMKMTTTTATAVVVVSWTTTKIPI